MLLMVTRSCALRPFDSFPKVENEKQKSARSVRQGNRCTAKDSDQPAAGESSMNVRLNSEEGNVLFEILEDRDRVLQKKISHTKREAPKTVLTDKETLLESIIEKLEIEQTAVQEFTDLWW